MKLSQKTAIVILFTILSFLLTKEAVYAATGTITTETLKLRESPSTDSAVLDLMSVGEDVEVLEKEGEWYKVVYEGTEGYAHEDYIEVEGEVEQPSEEVTPPTEEEPEVNNQEEVPEQGEQKPETTEQSNSGTMATNASLKILPLLQSASITEISTGDAVVVMARAGNWAYVSKEGINGWVLESQIQYDETTPSEETEEQNQDNTQENPSTENPAEEPAETPEEEPVAEEPAYEEKQAYVNSESINVREGPSMDADVVTTLTINTEVTIIGEENDFYHIRFDGQTGYVAERLLSDEKQEVTSRGDVERPAENTAQAEEEKDVAPEEETEESSGDTSTISKGEEVVNLAKTYLGYPYIYGGASPSRGFDCSGYTQYIFKQFGVSLSHSATAQSNVGTYVEKANLQLGDIVIFNDDANTSIGHVGIYIGGNNFIHASNPSDGVKITSLSSSYYTKRYVTARRLV